MSEHRASVVWTRKTSDFVYETYDRTHQIQFNGGQNLVNSAAPDFNGKAEHANPEELLAAAASSCHMLTFLAICARKKLVVDHYEDSAVAVLEKNAAGKMAVTKIVLSPRVRFGGSEPDAAAIKAIHDKAHDNCFIANSLSCEVVLVLN